MPKPNADLECLQKAIDLIDTGPRRQATEAKDVFVDSVSSKLFEIDANPMISDLLHENVTRLHSDYD